MASPQAADPSPSLLPQSPGARCGAGGAGCGRAAQPPTPARPHPRCGRLLGPARLPPRFSSRNVPCYAALPPSTWPQRSPAPSFPGEDRSLTPRHRHRRGERENPRLPRPDRQSRSVSPSPQKRGVPLRPVRSVFRHPLRLRRDELIRLQPKLSPVNVPRLNAWD